MKTWTVFSPYFFPAHPAVLSHAPLLEADIALPGAERALPRPPRPSVWWSSKPLALVPSIHSVQSRRKTGPRQRAPGCSMLYLPGIAASHPGAYQAGNDAFPTEARCVFCRGSSPRVCEWWRTTTSSPFPAGWQCSLPGWSLCANHSMPNHHLQGVRRARWSARQYLGQPPHTALLAGLVIGPNIAREPLEVHRKQRPSSVCPWRLPEVAFHYGNKQQPSLLLCWYNAGQDCHV